jgi:GH25 family lysozyme M1 (1,4-beta-N-acetylmuramidase)
MSNKILGMDVSRYQLQPDDIAAGRNIDWQKAWDAGIRWVAIRCTVGNYYYDPCFERFWNGAKSIGMKCSPYFVTAPLDTYGQRIRGKLQAQWAAEKFGERDYDFSPVLDAEIAKGGTEWTSAVNWEMMEYMRKYFGSGEVYTNAGFANSYLTASYWKNIDLFVASWYRDEPYLPNTWRGILGQPVRWQWTNKGIGKDYGCTSANVDLDYWLEPWDISPPPPVEPPVTEYPEVITLKIEGNFGTEKYSGSAKIKRQ